MLNSRETPNKHHRGELRPHSHWTGVPFWCTRCLVWTLLLLQWDFRVLVCFACCIASSWRGRGQVSRDRWTYMCMWYTHRLSELQAKQCRFSGSQFLSFHELSKASEEARRLRWEQCRSQQGFLLCVCVCVVYVCVKQANQKQTSLPVTQPLLRGIHSGFQQFVADESLRWFPSLGSLGQTVMRGQQLQLPESQRHQLRAHSFHQLEKTRALISVKVTQFAPFGSYHTAGSRIEGSPAGNTSREGRASRTVGF